MPTQVRRWGALTELLDGCFIKLFVLLDHLVEVTSSTVLEDDPEMVPCFVPIVKLENMSVFQVMEYAHLLPLVTMALTSFRTFFLLVFSTDLTAT